MAWNHPSDNQRQAAMLQKRGAMRQAIVRGIIAGLIIVMGVAGTWWWLAAKDEKHQNAVEPKTRQIQDVAPAFTNRTSTAAKSNAVAAVTKEPVEETVYGHRKVRVDKDGNRWIMQGGRERRLKRLNPGMSKPIFHNRADNQISAVLTCKPGNPIIGWKMDDSFVNDFLQSLKEPIVISKDDPPEIADEKRLVREAKIELKARYDAGEDIVQIMRDEYKNIAKNYNLRMYLVNELAKMREEGASAKDLDLFVESANVLMKNYGQENPLRLMKHERAQLKIENSTQNKESEE